MNQKDLQKRREELEKSLSRIESTHYKKPYWNSESAYRDSCKVINEVYKELFDVCKELGDPIPVRF